VWAGFNGFKVMFSACHCEYRINFSAFIKGGKYLQELGELQSLKENFMSRRQMIKERRKAPYLLVVESLKLFTRLISYVVLLYFSYPSMF
jgi:hypothetical protein